MPDLIQKSGIMQRFELFSNNPANQNSSIVTDAIARLGGNPALPNNDLLKIARDLGFYADDLAATHFRRHWLGRGGDAKPFWPTIQNTVNAVLRKGMLKACELYKQTGFPGEFWWVASGGIGTADFQMSVSVYRQRILVVFHTPLIPCDEPLVDSTRTFITLEDDTGTVVTRPAVVPAGSELPEPPPLAQFAAGARRRVVARRPGRRPGPPPKGPKRPSKKRVVKKAPAKGKKRAKAAKRKR
jgi:hypothetical protein